MDKDRWARVLVALAATRGPDHSRLCTFSAGIVAVSGAGITLMTEDGAARMTVCSSDHVAQVMEELQFSLGEGPCVDAYAQDRPVSEPDLTTAATGRWPAFAPAAVAAGAVAVFGFPLRAGAGRIGTLNLYRDRPGSLSDEQVADALVVADVIAREILSIQARGSAGVLVEGLVGAPELGLVVHQATGMVAAQLEIGVGEALIRLRARAFADAVPVTAVAVAVVNRELRFEPDNWPSTGVDT